MKETNPTKGPKKDSLDQAIELLNQRINQRRQILLAQMKPRRGSK